MELNKKAWEVALWTYNTPGVYASHQERLSAAFTAAAPHMSGVKVKQLEWSVLGRMHKADLYEIEDMRPNWSKDRYQLWYNRKVLQGVFVTLDEARSAAQEDFEDNVRECIDGGFDVAEVRRQALEEAAKLIEEGFDKAVGQAWRNDGFLTAAGKSIHLYS